MKTSRLRYSIIMTLLSLICYFAYDREFAWVVFIALIWGCEIIFDWIECLDKRIKLLEEKGE